MRIATAFRCQTVPCHLTICDVGGNDFKVPADTLASADSSYVWNHNHGSFNRFIPSFAYGCDYCWFHDDDMLPGPRLLEYILSWRHLPFSVLGQTGRRVVGQRYKVIDPAPAPQKVDFVCRGYLVKTAKLYNILRYAATLGLSREHILEDDILLAASINAYTGEHAWITPVPPKDGEMNAEELPAPYACQDMPDHRVRRTAFFHRCRNMTRQLHNTHPRIILLGTPSSDCRNIVMHARALAIRSWIRDQFHGFEIIAPDLGQRDLSRFQLSDADLIMVQADDTIGEQLLLPHGAHKGILHQYSRNKVFILGKSFHTSLAESDDLQIELRRNYAGHPSLYIVTSDSFSQNNAEKLFPNPNRIFMGPDLVTALPHFSPLPVGEYSVLCLRPGETDLLDPEMIGARLGNPWESISAEDSEITDGVRDWVVKAKIAQLQGASAIITNFQEGLLLAYLSRRPTVVLPSSDQAFMSSLEWFQNIPWIKLAPSVGDIPGVLAAVRLAQEKAGDDGRGYLGQELRGLASRLKAL